MSVLCLIQARVNSSRLPRKSLALIGCRASVFHVWKRALMAVDEAVVVVPRDDEGDFHACLPASEVKSCDLMDDAALKGEDNVLCRLAYVLEQMIEDDEAGEEDIIVRLTADCPFVDPGGIRAVAEAVKAGADYAYLDPVPNGLDAEAFTVDLLMRAHREATDPYDREHVCTWMRRQSVKIVRVPMFADLPRYRWTLDDAEDLQLLRDIADEVDCNSPHPTVPELLALMERRPDLAARSLRRE